MYFKRDKQSMAAKRPVRQRRGGSKVSPKKKRQLFLPESSGRTSCLVMSAVPPELPDVSGRSRALLFKRCPCNAGPAAHLLNGRRAAVFSLLLPGVRSRGARARLSAVPHSLGRTARATFPVPCICCFKIARWRHFVNLTARHRGKFCVFSCHDAHSLIKWKKAVFRKNRFWRRS